MSNDMHGRLPWLVPDELDEAQQRVYEQIVAGPRARKAGGLNRVDDQGRLEGPFNAMLIAPAIGDALQHLGQVVRFESRLSARARELIILLVAREARSDFEWYAHTLLGRSAGLTEDEISAVLHGRPLRGLDPTEDLAVRAATSVLLTGDLDDDLFAEARSGLGIEVVMELVVLVGYYRLIATQLRVWRTPLPRAVTGVFGASQD